MIYIIVCMTFVSIAMLYYGILLYLLRKTSMEITKKVGPMDTNEVTEAREQNDGAQL